MGLLITIYILIGMCSVFAAVASSRSHENKILDWAIAIILVGLCWPLALLIAFFAIMYSYKG